jgi:anti-anti-sigma factor
MLSSARVLSSVRQGVGPVLPIEISIEQVAWETVVRLAGSGGFDQADSLTASLLPLSASRPHLVTLDLSRLHFISSLVIGALVSFRRGVVRTGGRVRLAGDLQEPVREALERTGLLALFGWVEPKSF